MGRVLPPLLLLAVLSICAWYAIPCHWMGMALDPEFSGWVAPVANRFAEGMVLYADGGHSPLPPLPFVLLYGLGRGHAVWLTESAVNTVCLALMVLLIEAALARAIGRPLAWLAALGAVPVFLQSPKSLAYDALVQCFVAGFGLAILVWFEAPRPRRLVAPVVLGAVMLLTKHNTGAGALLGGAVAIAVLAHDVPVRDRLTALTILTVGTLGVTMLLLLAATPWVSFPGFVHDVLLRGTIPKGGPTYLLANLATTRAELGDLLAPGFALGAVVLVALGTRAGAAVRWPMTLIAAVGAVAGLVIVLRLDVPVPVPPVPLSVAVGSLPWIVLRLGLAAALLGFVAACVRAPLRVRRLGILTAIWFPAAVAHALSVAIFRWTYDTNPLIALAIAWPLVALAGMPGAMFAVGGAVLQLGLWSSVGPTVQRWQSCTDAWPEVPARAGARMPPTAAELRTLVARVQALAPNASDEVLLLPNDPDLESMLGRPRPRLTSAIIFVDQYWDEYVEEDLARLIAHPPAVVLMGPAWNRVFQWGWNGQGKRADRLMAQVDVKLLGPLRYRLVGKHTVMRIDGTHDAIQIFVRR